MNIILLKLLAVFALALLPCTSAGRCYNMDLNMNEYGCGKGYYEYGYFETNPATSDCRCCCREEDGTGYHIQTCDGSDPFPGSFQRTLESNPFRSWPKGCGACMGVKACYDALNSKIGDSSCVGEEVCSGMENSNIKQKSCHGFKACIGMEHSNVGYQSCYGERACRDYLGCCNNIGDYSCYNRESCHRMSYTHIGDRSCQYVESCLDVSNTHISDGSCNYFESCRDMSHTLIGRRSCLRRESCRYMRSSSFAGRTFVGSDSCQKDGSCNQYALDISKRPDYGNRLNIGSNSCNYENVCRMCENDSVVPDNACNGYGDDTTYVFTDLLGFWAHLLTCNYCRSQYRSLSTEAGISPSRRRLTEVDLNISCNDLADTLKNYIIEHVEAHAMFKNFVHEVITDHCNSDKKPSNLVEFIPDEDNGRCTVKIDFVMKTRLKNGDETPLVDRIQEKVNEFCASNKFDFSCDSIVVTDEVVEEKDCSKAAGSGSESSKGSSTNEGGAKAGKDGKGSQAEAMVERHRMREHKSGKGKNGK